MAGLGLSSLDLGLGSRGASGPAIVLSATSIAEDAASSSTVGTLSVVNHPSGSSGWTFAETADPDNKFAVSGADLNTSAALNYETATSHSVTITASKAAQTDIVRTFTITVTNVFEAANLAALGFSGTLYQNTSSTITITSATATSTLALATGSLPAGMTLNSGARTITGTPTTLGSGSAGIDETLADSANSPRPNTWNWEVVEAPATTPEIWPVIGDSRAIGVLDADRGGADLTALPAGVKQWSQSNTLVSTLPLEHSAGVATPDPIGPGETFIVQRHTDVGENCYVIPCGVGGSSVTSWLSTHLTGQLTRINAGIAAIKAVDATAVAKGALVCLGTNTVETVPEFETRMATLEASLRAGIFKNGASGATVDADFQIIYIGMRGEHRASSAQAKNAMEIVLRELGAQATNAYVDVPRNPTNYANDGLHESVAGARALGLDCAEQLTDTTAAVITLPATYSVYEDQRVGIAVVSDKYVWPTVDDAAFEIAWTWPAASSGSGSEIITPRLRTAGNGDSTPGTYPLVVSGRSGTGTTATQGITVTSVAAYGTQVETVVPLHVANLFPSGLVRDLDGDITIPDVPLKRGFNHVAIIKSGGPITDITSARSDNGLIGVKDANANSSNWPYYFYSAQDQTVDLILAGDNAPSAFGIVVTNAVGTVAAPSDSSVLPRGSQVQTSASLTCPTNGIIIGGGFCVSGTTAAAGCTQLNTPDAFWFSGYRTTTGGLGVTQNADGGMAAIALAKA